MTPPKPLSSEGMTVRRRRPSTSGPTSVPARPEPGPEPPLKPSDAHSPVSALWLESRISPESPGGYRPQGEDRPFTLRNVRIATRLIQSCGPRLLALFIKGQEWRMIAYLGGMLSRGLLPTAKIWASSKLLDLVQKSFEPDGVESAEVIRVALTSMLLSIAGDGIQHALRSNDAIVRSRVDTVLERAYFATKLSLSIPNLSSPYVAALMNEAGIFTGAEYRTVRHPNGGVYRSGSGGAFDALTSAFSLITNLIGILSQLALMYSALTGGAVSNLGWSTIILIILSIAPALLRTMSGLLRPNRGQSFMNGMRTREVNEMARSGVIRQEILLYGLRHWVLDRWDAVKRATEIEMQTATHGRHIYDFSLHIVEEAVQNSFYVLLALRVLPTSLSLGSIRLYQRTVESLLGSIRSSSNTAKQVFNNIFFMAAYVEAIELANHPHLLRPPAYRNTEPLDFEAYRVQGGMGLVAKDLSFRYPGTTKDVLSGINLTIPPGTTLAIVGLNGGGKTTLVKVLMGLFDHQGSLSLNGQPMAAFDPASVHRRTSCLFQDFCKYSFTLRENVGIGQVDQMADDGLVGLAIERGGAGVVLEKVGLEGKLSQHGVPGSGGQGDIEWSSDDRPRRRGKSGLGDGKGGLLKRVKGVLESVGAASVLRSVVGSSGGFSTPLISTNSGLANTNLEIAQSEKSAAPATSGKAPATKGDGENEQSAKLSGGQWQRVALARAFMRASEADLVVFDEPSASLDPKAESLLFAQIHALSHQEGRRCTTIFISHRFSTTRKADQIAVVEDGTISEIGSHNELMEAKGRYHELYLLQKQGFED